MRRTLTTGLSICAMIALGLSALTHAAATGGAAAFVDAAMNGNRDAVRTLWDLAHTTGLRGAETVIVGIQPEAAFAMVQLGLNLNGVGVALDLEEGLEFLAKRVKRPRARG